MALRLGADGPLAQVGSFAALGQCRRADGAVPAFARRRQLASHLWPKPHALAVGMEEAGAMSCLPEFIAATSFLAALDQFAELDQRGDQAPLQSSGDRLELGGYPVTRTRETGVPSRARAPSAPVGRPPSRCNQP